MLFFSCACNVQYSSFKLCPPVHPVDDTISNSRLHPEMLSLTLTHIQSLHNITHEHVHDWILCTVHPPSKDTQTLSDFMYIIYTVYILLFTKRLKGCAKV